MLIPILLTLIGIYFYFKKPAFRNSINSIAAVLISFLRLQGFIDLTKYIFGKKLSEKEIGKIYAAKTRDLFAFYLPFGFVIGFVATLLEPKQFELSYSFGKLAPFWGGLITGTTLVGTGLLIILGAVIRSRGVAGIKNEADNLLHYLKGNASKKVKYISIGFTGLFLILLFLNTLQVGQGWNTIRARKEFYYQYGSQFHRYVCPRGYVKAGKETCKMK